MSQPLLGFIFSAGKGTRLSPYTNEIPKPILLKYQDRCFLEINIEKLLALGAKHIYVNYSYGYNYFKDIQSKFKNKVTLIHEPQLIGHGKTILNLITEYNIPDKTYLYTINGDTLIDFDREDYLNTAKNKQIDFSILTDNNIEVPKNLLVDHNNNVIGCKINERDYFYKDTLKESLYKNGLGEYVINIENFNKICEEGLKQNFLGLFGDNDLIEIMLKNEKIVKCVDKKVNSHVSINTIEEYNNFNKKVNDR